MTYQLDIIGDDVRELVRHAGGWIYDRVAAGWRVTVLLPAGDDPRPMRILGAHTEVVSPTDGFHGRCPQAIATSARLCRLHPDLVADLGSAMRTREAEIILWGEDWPHELDGTPDPATHRLSFAARAFKAQALTAAGVGLVPITAAENFRTASAVRSWVGADLVPAG
ncbi:hypothetical protein [Gordonia sp. NPDC127522]|uniref:hypothetical protein n=1 Tax=Gordonia sp. NPDC127522 TaxID=3345390 RepID=UPI0036261E7C